MKSYGVGHLVGHAPVYLSFLLLLLSVFLLARLLWLLFSAEPAVPNEAEKITGLTTASLNKTVDQGKLLAGFHLFGVHNPQGNSGPKIDQEPPPTPLALTLQGVYAFAGKRGFAIIDVDGKQKVFTPGETIGSSGAVLEQVMADHVILTRNGVKEKLTLPKSEGGGGSAAASLDATDRETADYQDQGMNDGEPAMDIAAGPGIQPFDIAMEIKAAERTRQNQANGSANLGQFRQQVIQDNAKLLDMVSPQPYMQDGKFAGIQVTPGSNPALFNQAGLQPGDIVTAINGQALTSPASSLQALQSVANASNVTLGIVRNGQVMSLPLSF